MRRLIRAQESGDWAPPDSAQSDASEQKPEAVYFTDDRGQRCGYLFIEMADASQIPAFAEPWFMAFNAQIELHPAMTTEDLAKAAPSIERAVEKFGK